MAVQKTSHIVINVDNNKKDGYSGRQTTIQVLRTRDISKERNMILVAFPRQSAIAHISQQKYEINIFCPLQIKYCDRNDDFQIRITR